MVAQPIRVLVIDDSALVRQLLTELLSSDPMIEVVATAADPLIARAKINELNPDVLTLDIEMPHMDGLTFLEKLMRLRPMPVVMVSSLTQEGADSTLRALELGAVDFVAKPTLDLSQGLTAKRDELIAKVKAAAEARVHALVERHTRPAAAASLDSVAGISAKLPKERVVAVGASTGGVDALTEIFMGLPAGGPAILVVQHMPAGFTANFARRLDKIVAPKVVEAIDGTPVEAGTIYIAPGNRHLELVRSGRRYLCRLGDGPLVSGHRPSVDVLFNSVAEAAGGDAVGVILTGMGKDGATGMASMSAAGATTIGQDEATSVVHGMPAAARALGGVQMECPIFEIADEILRAAARPATTRPAARRRRTIPQSGA